jgi:hypothetical protein
MNLLASFSGSLQVKLKKNHQPDNGFFYLSSIELDDNHILLSSFIHPEGNCEFWEERVVCEWSESSDAGMWDLDVSGQDIGLSVSFTNMPEMESSLLSKIEQGEFSPRIKVSFKIDGDSDEDLVLEQHFNDLDSLEIRTCSEDEWEEEGYS